MYPKSVRRKAVQLRQQGYSYNKLSMTLGVAKSTLQKWLKHVKLTTVQKEALNQNVKEAVIESNKRRAGSKRSPPVLTKTRRQQLSKDFSRRNKTRYRKNRDDLFYRYREQVNPLHGVLNGETLALVGAALYWGEGTKRGQFNFSNSDSDMILLYMRWAREVLNIKDSDFSGHVQVYLDHGIPYDEVEAYWSQLTKIPSGQFTKPHIFPAKKSAKRPLLYGTLHVRSKKGTKHLAKFYALAEVLGKKNSYEQFVKGE